MNSKLLKLYSSKWENLCTSMHSILSDKQLEIKPTCPLLLSIKNEEEYNNSDIRLMIYGQETNSWYDKFHNNMESILDCYDSFFNEGECWRYGGQFWNGVNRFVELLQIKYPTKAISIVWNNIVKIGKYNDKGFPPDYIYEIEREHFSIVVDELKIIKPNIVLFLTGPNYDSSIEDNFGKLNYSKITNEFSERELAKLDLLDVPFSFRTYHPNYLWRNNINNYFNSILDSIIISDILEVKFTGLDKLAEELSTLKQNIDKYISAQKYEEAAQLRGRESLILNEISLRK
jgi:hypothetical protein